MAYDMIPIGGGHFLIVEQSASFVLTSITPSTGKNSIITDVNIVGTEFVNGCTVTIGDIDLTNVKVKSDILIKATIPARISAGTYDITVTKPDTSAATLSNGFIVIEILDVSAINPVSAYNNIATSAIIYGSKFVDGAAITIGGISLTGVIFTNSFELTATIPTGVSEGNQNVKVINLDTSNATLVNGFLSKVRIDDTAPTNKGSRLRSRTIYNMLS